MIGDDASLSDDSQRSEAIAKLQTHLSFGIALLLAVDSYLNGMTKVGAMAREYGLFRSVDPHVSDSLVGDGVCEKSAFEPKRTGA